MAFDNPLKHLFEAEQASLVDSLIDCYLENKNPNSQILNYVNQNYD